jgi:hypothetical protein
MEENQDTDKSDLEPGIKQSKSTRKQLKESLAQIDKLLNFKSMKSAKLADLAIERSGLIKLLLQIEHDEKADKNLALKPLNEQLTARVAELEKENAELKHELQSRANQRVQHQTPDNRVPALQEQVSTLEELLKTVATLARSCDIESRTRHAVSLVIKYGKQVFPVVEGIGVDFSSVAVALQKSETELLGLLQQAQQEGTGTPIWRAVLAVKYQVQVDGHGKRQTPYRDEFDSESSLYADTL